MHNQTHGTHEEILDRLSRNKTLELLPVITYVAALMLCGGIGNILVCCFYGKKSKTTATNRLIVAVAITDSFVCVLMPKNIAVMCLSYRGYSSILCRINVFINHLCAIASGMLLVAIASFRYRAVCKHAASQFNTRHANIAISIALGLALSTSIPVLFVYETVSVNFTLHDDLTVSGYDCNGTPDESLTLLSFIVSGVHFCLFAGATITFIILYSIIGSRIWKYYRTKRRLTGMSLSREQSRGTQGSLLETELNTNNNGTQGSLLETELNTNNNMDHETNSRVEGTKHNLNGQSKPLSEVLTTPKRGRLQIESREKFSAKESCSHSEVSTDEGGSKTKTMKLNTIQKCRVSQEPGTIRDVQIETTLHIAIRQAVMLLVITVIFVLSFLPYLAMSIFRTMSTNRNPNDDFTVLVKFCQNSYLLNSASNPFVYGFFSLEFRNFVKRIMCRPFKRCFKTG